MLILRKPLCISLMFDFLPSKAELRPSSSMSSSSISNMASGVKQPVMCKSLMETGACQRGEVCNFAHTPEQLSMAQAADPKYKSALCASFKAKGSCEWGSNCKFAHGMHELRRTPQQGGGGGGFLSQGTFASYGPSGSGGSSAFGGMSNQGSSLSMSMTTGSSINSVLIYLFSCL